jgi:hypothetical protein
LVDRLKAEMRKTLQAGARNPNVFPPAPDIRPPIAQLQKRKQPEATSNEAPENDVLEDESLSKLPRRSEVDEEYVLTRFVCLYVSPGVLRLSGACLASAF